jgi:hypothetical protein
MELCIHLVAIVFFFGCEFVFEDLGVVVDQRVLSPQRFAFLCLVDEAGCVELGDGLQAALAVL